MAQAQPFGGGVWLADTSVWARAPKFEGDLRSDWATALRGQIVATHDLVVAEIMSSAQNASKLGIWISSLGALDHRGRIDEDESDLLAKTYEWLASHGKRGIPPTDVYCACSASRHGWGILHYDKHFDILAGVDFLDFESQWIVRRGTMD